MKNETLLHHYQTLWYWSTSWQTEGKRGPSFQYTTAWPCVTRFWVSVLTIFWWFWKYFDQFYVQKVYNDVYIWNSAKIVKNRQEKRRRSDWCYKTCLKSKKQLLLNYGRNQWNYRSTWQFSKNWSATQLLST